MMRRFPYFLLFFFLVTWAMPKGISFANAEPLAQPGSFAEADCWFESPLPLLPSPEFECGYVYVPERHEDPAGQLIRLPVAVLPAEGDTRQPDPLFMAQGGPGGDAFEIFPILVGARTAGFDRDIVIFNQRGTLYSEPELSCDETKEITEQVLLLPGEEADAISLEALDNCYNRLESAGVDLSAYNSLQNAADVDLIREALGYGQYNFYGVSYGTLLGLHLLRNHSDNLRSVILDGVVPPNVNFITEIASNTDRVFTEIIEFCEVDPECQSEYPNLEDRFFKLVADLNQNPEMLTIKDSESAKRYKARLDGDTLVDLLFQAFYLPDSYAIFPKLVANLEDGDYTFIHAIWPLFVFNRSISEGMYFSVICAEDADFALSEASLEDIRPYFAAGAIGEMQTYQDACAIWQVDPLAAEVDDAVYSEIPTLLISGHFDPITPPSFAAVAAATLDRGYSFVTPTGSHGVAFDDDCMNEIVDQFLASPENKPDAGCLDEVTPVDFVPANAISFPFLTEVNRITQTMWVQLAAASLFLIGVLSSYLVLPLAWLINLFRKKDLLSHAVYPGARRLKWIAAGLTLLFGVLAVVFVAGILVYTIQSFMNGMANIFSLSAAAVPFFVIPLVLAMIALVLLFISVRSWRRSLWSRWTRIYFAFLALCAVGYVLVLAMGGMLTVLL
jgi:pimeloyl-ACP methyl ester carboxylesterase